MPRTALNARIPALLAVLALAVPLAGCSDDESDVTAPPQAVESPDASPSASAAAGAVTGDIVVFAAASLTETFTELGEKFEAANPGSNVTFQFGASSTLATQINEAAPADVFASASPATMTTVTDAGNAAGEPSVFVRNTLEIAVPEGNPGEVEGIEDFADESLDIALCAAEVPCGAAADKALMAAGVEAAPDTRENDVKAVLTKVELGEVDAALVYRTDVNAAGDTVEGIEFPEAAEAINDYPIVVLKESDNAEAARAWVAYVQSDEAQQILQDAGFDRG